MALPRRIARQWPAARVLAIEQAAISTEATGGVKAQGVRYVLGVSLLLIVIAMSAIWILGSVLG